MRDQVSLLMQTQGCALGPCDFRGIKTSWKMCVQARWTRATETDRDTNTETHTHTQTDTGKHTGWHAAKDTRTHTHTQKDTHTHTHRYAHCTDWHICAQTSGNCRQRQRAWESQRKRERERQNKVKITWTCIKSKLLFHETTCQVSSVHDGQTCEIFAGTQAFHFDMHYIELNSWLSLRLFGRIFLMGLGVVSFCLAEFAFTVYKVPVHFNLIACFLTFQVR